LRFWYEDNRLYHALGDYEKTAVYLGFRPKDSLSLHKNFSKKHGYNFKEPVRPLYRFMDIGKERYKQNVKVERTSGMTEGHINDNYEFDSCFESGNLDMAIQVNKNEYDLYMRVDSNTRGHHQWFYFSVKNKIAGKVKFNIVNFTKGDSLYKHGMRITIYSEKKAERANKGEVPKLYTQWHRGGENIIYKPSKLSQELFQQPRTMYCC